MKRLAALLLLNAALLLAMPASAERRNGVSLDDVVGQVYSDRDRRVISARTVRKGERRVHEVKTLSDDGHLRRERYDARTGRRVGR